MDDPSLPEFESWTSYEKFAKRVRQDRRFATDPASRAFIATVLATVPQRDMSVSNGQILYRAQIGISEEVVNENGEDRIWEWGYPAERMKPIPAKAQEGRANPGGIAFLYLASDEQTAISEVRPWIGSKVSVAQFRVLRDLRIVNLTLGHGHHGILLLTVEELARNRRAWTMSGRNADITDPARLTDGVEKGVVIIGES